MNALRIAGRVLAGFLAVIVTVVMLGLLSANRLAGSSGAVGSAVASLVDSPDGARALGAVFVDMALGEDNPDRAKITASAEALTAAAAQGLQASRDDLVGLAQTAYDAAATGTAAEIDAAPVLNRVLAAMNAVDSEIPADVGKDGGNGDEQPGVIKIDASTDTPVPTIKRILGLWWLAFLVALLLLGAVGWASKARGLRRWRASGLLFGITGLVWLVAASVAPNFALAQITDPVQLDLATQIRSIAARQFLMSGGLVFLLGAALFGATFVKRGSDVAETATPESATYEEETLGTARLEAVTDEQ